MKKMISRRQFTTGTISLLGTTQATASTKLPFTVAVYDNYPPMSNFINENYWEGLFVDFARRFTLGIDNAEMIFVTDLMWNRALNDIELGRLSMLFQLSYREERNKFIQYIGSTGVERKYVVLADTNPTKTIDTYDDLANIEPPVFINRSSAHSPEFDRRIKEEPEFRAKFNIQEWIITEEDDPYEQIVKLISAGRNGGFIALESDLPLILELSEQLAAKDKNIVKIRAIEIPMFGAPVSHVGVSRKVPQSIRDQIANNYAESRVDGSFEKIWQTWHPGRKIPPNIAPEKSQ